MAGTNPDPANTSSNTGKSNGVESSFGSNVSSGRAWQTIDVQTFIVLQALQGWQPTGDLAPFTRPKINGRQSRDTAEPSATLGARGFALRDHLANRGNEFVRNIHDSLL